MGKLSEVHGRKGGGRWRPNIDKVERPERDCNKNDRPCITFWLEGWCVVPHIDYSKVEGEGGGGGARNR